MPDFCIEVLRDIIRYDKDSGEFYWLKSSSKKIKPGDIAGCYRKDGYKVIRTSYGLHLGHRIAWAIVTGEWPKTDVDHKDGNPSNNKWANLRQISHSKNVTNQSCHKDNKIGQRGIKLHKNGRYYVSINKKSFGGYASLAEAVKARDLALKQEYGELVRI